MGELVPVFTAFVTTAGLVAIAYIQLRGIQAARVSSDKVEKAAESAAIAAEVVRLTAIEAAGKVAQVASRAATAAEQVANVAATLVESDAATAQQLAELHRLADVTHRLVNNDYSEALKIIAQKTLEIADSDPTNAVKRQQYLDAKTQVETHPRAESSRGGKNGYDVKP